MKPIRILNRSITNACKSIIRNFSLSIASITCTVITLVLVAVGILVSYNVNNIAKETSEKLTIVVFMDKDITEEELKNTTEMLEKTENVAKVKYNSKNDIKKQLASGSELYSKIISTWTEDENPLQDSYVIELKNVNDIKETATTIKNMDKVSIVKYGENVVGILLDIFDFIKKASIALVVGLVLVTIFLVNNTIKITIFSRRKEIDIMRLVGTSNTVIKLPFLIEGFLIGTIGSIIPILATIFGYNYIYKALYTSGLGNILNIIQLVEPQNIVYTASLFIFVVGAFVGMFGSVRAVRKYLTI